MFWFCGLFTVYCGLDIGGFETLIEYLIATPIYRIIATEPCVSLDYGCYFDSNFNDTIMGNKNNQDKVNRAFKMSKIMLLTAISCYSSNPSILCNKSNTRKSYFSNDVFRASLSSLLLRAKRELWDWVKRRSKATAYVRSLSNTWDFSIASTIFRFKKKRQKKIGSHF